MIISIARQGDVIGSFEMAEAKAKLLAGEILPTDHYWHEGLDTWRPAELLASAGLRLPIMKPAFRKRSILASWLGKPSNEELLAALWDLMRAASAHGLPTEEQVLDLEARLGADIRARCRPALKAWYGKFVAAALSDKVFTEEERQTLQLVAKLFHIPAFEAQQVYQSAVADLYANSLPLMLRASKDFDEARRMIESLEGRLALPAEFFEPHRRAAIGDHLQHALGKVVPNAVSPSQIESLDRLAEMVDLPFRDDVGFANDIELSEHLWAIREGTLPVIDCPLILDKGEVCHWRCHTEMFQMKRVTTRVNYQGISSSVRIMQGLYWRSGSYSIARETEDMYVSIDRGELLITNKRVIFGGKLKNLSIKYAKILDVCGYKDAIGIDLSAGVGPRFIIPMNPRVPYEMIVRLCKDDRV